MAAIGCGGAYDISLSESSAGAAGGTGGEGGAGGAAAAGCALELVVVLLLPVDAAGCSTNIGAAISGGGGCSGGSADASGS